MLALYLIRSSRGQITNLNKISILSADQCHILKCLCLSPSADRYFSNLSRNTETSVLNKSNNISCFDKKYLRIPPTNKTEFDEFRGAFLKELTKFSLSDLKQSPKTHLIYGAGGLAPFVLPPLQMLMFGYSDGMAWMQLAYAATILSYLGGIQWGATLPDASKSLPSYEAMSLAVAPQLVAWIALLFPTPLGLITTSAALTATLAVDLLKYNYPPWFKSLRIFLTLGAVGSLAGTLFGAIVA